MILGIDTSNYKTSVAVTDRDGNIIFERSEYLLVDKGKRGLRQSEAFFMHSNRLPDYMTDLFSHVGPGDIEAVGVSSRPRRVEGSYMPCFLAGVNAAREVAAALRVPVYEFSHQEGHAAAIIQRGFDEISGRALLFHLSGGTTEFLLCEPDDMGYSLEIVGGTRDISIGQLIDRAGVAMGFAFPSGMYLDRLAQRHAQGYDEKNCDKLLKPVIPNDGCFNLSGPETQVQRAIEAYKTSEVFEASEALQSAAPDETASPFYAALSFEIFDCIAALLARSAAELAAQHGVRRVYMAGGVASSAFLRERIYQKLDAYLKKSRKTDSDTASYAAASPEIVFGDSALSGDNAAGTAFLAARQYLRSKNT